jgi:hypothetical protein
VKHQITACAKQVHPSEIINQSMKASLCITTYVTGRDYQEFIPVFIYSLFKAYPHYEIIIFCGEYLDKSVRKNLSILEKICDFKIIENYLPHKPSNLDNRVASMSKRWLIYCDDFLNYEYLYIGDIDIAILKENPDLLIQHKIHCDTINLIYSNVRRRTHSNRITGLHFVKTKEYFEKMYPVIDKFKYLFLNNKLKYKYSCEYMLYDMIIESELGLCPRATGKGVFDPHNESFRPHHGIHLAVFRDLLVKKKEVSSKHFVERMKNFKAIIDDPIFKSIESNFETKMMRRIFKRVHNFKIEQRK